jgi:hypothetical protein
MARETLTVTVTHRGSAPWDTCSLEAPIVHLTELATGRKVRWHSDKLDRIHYTDPVVTRYICQGDILTLAATVSPQGTLQRVKVLAFYPRVEDDTIGEWLDTGRSCVTCALQAGGVCTLSGADADAETVCQAWAD